MNEPLHALLAKAYAVDGIGEAFRGFVDNLKLDNEQTISDRYGEITCALNKKFRDTESKTANSLQVGSHGRWTAIKGISDLDMLYIMPAGSWSCYKDGGQAQLLRAAADAISARYPLTTVKVDRLVVQILYQDFQIEVQPVFLNDDGTSFTYPDTYNGGKWKVTKPREELAAMSGADAAKNKNFGGCAAWLARGKTSTASRWVDCSSTHWRTASSRQPRTTTTRVTPITTKWSVTFSTIWAASMRSRRNMALSAAISELRSKAVRTEGSEGPQVSTGRHRSRWSGKQE